MSYKEEYFKIIEFRKNNTLSQDVYGENHHILPRSIFPQYIKDKDNIVRLSAEEHFKAHYYLWKFYKEELKDKVNARKMCFAFNCMKIVLSKCNNIDEMSKLYAEVREDFAKASSEMMKGKRLSEETRRKISIAGKGRHHTEETKKRISESKKGDKCYLYGKHLSEETKRKLSIAHKNISEETRRKMSEKSKGNKRALGMKHTEEFKDRLRKPVVQFDKDGNFIREWKSISEVKETLGIDKTSISKCCKRMRHFNTAGGFIWRYGYEQH